MCSSFCETVNLTSSFQADLHKLYERVEYNANSVMKQMFNMEVEQHLLEYIKQGARMHYGMIKTDVRKLAYQYAAASK